MKTIMHITVSALFFIVSLSAYGMDTAIIYQETRNCSAESAAGIGNIVCEILIEKVKPFGLNIVEKETAGGLIFVGGSTSSDMLFIKRQSDDSPNNVIFVCVEGAPGNFDDSPRSKFRIVVRIVGTTESSSTFTSHSDWMLKSDLKEGALKSASVIAGYYEKKSKESADTNKVDGRKIPDTSGFNRPSFGSGLTGVVPSGEFSGMARRGFGLSFYCSIDGLVRRYTGINGSLAAGTSVIMFKTNRPNISSLNSLSVYTGAGYLFSFAHYTIVPHAGGGILYSKVKADFDGKDPKNGYSYKDRSYCDPLVYLSAHASMGIVSFRIFAEPSYWLFFEKGAVGKYLSLTLGAKYEI